MKIVVAFLLLSLPFCACAQTPKPATLRSTLLEQLRTTHNQKDWFVPISVAMEGLTAEQASWKDTSGNHSIGQLTYHLLFWNRRELAKFKNEPRDNFSGNNEETFNNFDSKQWNDTVNEAAGLGLGNSPYRHTQRLSRRADHFCPQAARFVESRQGSQVNSSGMVVLERME